MRMRMVLIPEWVEKALTAANKPLTTALDVVELSNTISKEDVAIYVDLNDRLFEKIFSPLSDTFDKVSLYPYGFGETTDERLKEMQSYLTRKLLDLHLEYPEAKIFDLLGEGYESESFSNKYTYESVYLKDDIIGIRIVSRKEDESDFSEDVRAYGSLLKTLNMFMPFEKLASTSVFNHYTSLLKAVA